MEPSLLAIYAHPDDEAFGTGGTIARYASEGVKTYLVCATRGEVGEISDPGLATPETLGQVREGELRCAAETMGVAELIFLDYRDSGMAGTEENRDPRAFINAPAEEVIARLVAIIRRLRPQVVATFEPNGGYGHPDHIAIHRHTVAAFHAAADTQYQPELGRPWQASRLFYTAIPRSFFVEMRQQLEALGEDTSDFDSFDDSTMGWPDDQVHVRLDVASTVGSKWDALNCHRTQFGPGNLFRRLPDAQVKALMSVEYFALAWPQPLPGLQLDGLFDRLA
jgi:N-acetyl-1-D-myo-inositol-2-amino-2-deoxy-alpha-D-glucopyranoside deacetylase